MVIYFTNGATTPFGVSSPIAAPDLYPINRPGVRHICEDTDAAVASHFVRPKSCIYRSVSEVMPTG